MKKARLSTRLFVSFGAVLILLIAVIFVEYVVINNIRESKERLVNATSINDSTSAVRLWTLDYYAVNSDEAAINVEENYKKTKTLIEQSFGLYKDSKEKNAIDMMSANLDLYYDSFVRYKQFADQNKEYYSDMENTVKRIISKLNQIGVAQQDDFTIFIYKAKRIKTGAEVDLADLLSVMTKEYNEASNSKDAVNTIQRVMSAELQYLQEQNVGYDREVYTELDSLKTQCDWLYNNFEVDEDKQAVDDVRNMIDDYLMKYESYKHLLDSQAEQEAILSDITLEITDSASDLAAAQEIEMADNFSYGIGISLVVGIISIVVGLLLASIISRSLSKRLITNMNQLSNSAEFVSKASLQLASASQKFASGSTEQAASIEETSATMEQTSSMVKLNAEHTRNANVLSNKASEAAANGGSKVSEMNDSMDELKKSSSEISKIIKVIDDVAFQTNMLALNAAVEAARAGDAGLGFAVVAEEVRNLAGKSAKAAKDTAEIIDKNIELSCKGVTISDEVGKTLENIMIETQNVNHIIGEISKASDEQAKGTAQVSLAIAEMEKVVQSNAASAEESATSAEKLKNQSDNLQRVVSELNSIVNGDGNAIKQKVTTEKLKGNSLIRTIKDKVKNRKFSNK